MGAVRVEVRGEGLERASRGAGVVYSKWVRPLGSPRLGGLVELVSPEGEPVACGLWEEGTPVAVRILYYGSCVHGDPEAALREAVEEAFRARVRSGWAQLGSYRLVNSDGDGLSGLIVDVYGDVAVFQVSSPAIDVHLETLVEAVASVAGVEHVYEKSTQRSRLDIGLEPRRRWLRGGKREVVIEEWGVKFIVDVVDGQKTGFFLDQRPNRLEARRYAPGERVLDVFSYTGGFGLHAAHEGAREVVFIEEDPRAARLLVRNLRLNGVARYRVINRSLWEVSAEEVGDGYGLVTVDPPAFIQEPGREALRRGLKAYRRAYAWSLERLREGGVAYLSSCSYFLDRRRFLELVAEVASAARRWYRLLGGVRGAGPDHTLRAEGYLEYLKGVFLEVGPARAGRLSGASSPS